MSKEEISNRLRDAGNGLHGLAADADYILAKLDAVRAERDAYRAERESEERRGDLLRDAYEDSVAERDQLKRQVESFEHAEQQDTTVPRVITRDELRKGQCVAVGHNGHWRIIETGRHIEEMSGAEILDHFAIYPGDTLVLLENAPAEEPEPVKVGDTINSDTRAAELPEGTILLDDDADPWRKSKCGHWQAADRGSDELVYRTAKPVFYTNDPLTVLYLPKEDA